MRGTTRAGGNLGGAGLAVREAVTFTLPWLPPSVVPDADAAETGAANTAANKTTAQRKAIHFLHVVSLISFDSFTLNIRQGPNVISV